MTHNPIEILAVDLFTNRVTIMRRSDNYDTRTTRNLTPRQTFSVIKLVNTMQDKGHCEIIAARVGIVAVSTQDSEPNPIDDLRNYPTADIEHDLAMMLADFGPTDPAVKAYQAELNRRKHHGK
jgi:hypothetical protein